MTGAQPQDSLIDVPGIKVGHAADLQGYTGCTVVLCEGGAVGGVDVRGLAPGTRELDAIHPLHLVEHVDAVLLAGGSAFGLDAAGGVMEELEARGQGFPVGPTCVPIVPAAILFDLSFGDHRVRPDKAMGREACRNAGSAPFSMGSVGAGTGATVGKLRGIECAMKGGLGSASATLDGGCVVGALAVVNAFGDVVDKDSGDILAGLRDHPSGTTLVSTNAALKQGTGRASFTHGNTTLVVIGANARLSKLGATQLARSGHDALARVIRPVHTSVDGDTIFALSTGGLNLDLEILAVVAQEVVEIAVLRAVQFADGFGILPAVRDLRRP